MCDGAAGWLPDGATTGIEGGGRYSDGASRLDPQPLQNLACAWFDAPHLRH